MKAIITGLLAAVVLLAGCNTLQDAPSAQRLANRLESVAFIGTVKVIQNNPEIRIIFEEVREELEEQEKRGSITFETFVSILRKLPINELEGQEGMLYFEAGRAIFYPDGESLIDLGESGEGLHILASGVRKGIERGLSWEDG